MASLGDLMVRVGANVDGYMTAMDTVVSKASTTVDQVESRFAKFETVGMSLAKIGAGLTGAVTLPILGIGSAAISAFGDFESSINRASAVGDIYGANLEKLKQQALDLGAKTQFSAKQAADGMAELAASGFNTTQIMAAMPAVLNLAASGQMEVGRAAEIASNLMAGFKIPAEDVGKAVDIMAKAAASGSLNVNDMASTFRYVGPVAQAAGLSLTEVAAATTLLSNAGIKGEQAGTTLRGALARLLDPSKEAAEALKSLGVQVTDSSGKLLPFANIVEQLGAKGATTKDIFKIFGQETASGMQALVTAGAPALRRMADELANSEGAAKKMAETLNKGWTGAVEKMRGSIDTAEIALGKVLAPVLIKVAGYIESAANMLSSFITWFGQLPAPVQEAAGVLTMLVAAAGPLILALGAIGVAVPAIVAGWKSLSVVGELLSLTFKKTAVDAATAGTAVATSGTQAGTAASSFSGLATVLRTAGWLAAAYEIGQLVVAVSRLRDAKQGLATATQLEKDKLEELLISLRQQKIDVSDLSKQYNNGEISQEKFKQGLTALVIEHHKSRAAVGDNTAALVTAKKAIEENAAETRKAKDELKAAHSVLAETTKLYKLGAASATDVAKAQQKVRDASAKVHPELKQTGVATAGLTKEQKELKKQLEAGTGAFGGFSAAALDQHNKIVKLKGQYVEAQFALYDLNQEIREGRGPLEIFAHALDGIKFSLSALMPDFETFSRVMNAIGEQASTTADAFGDAMKRLRVTSTTELKATADSAEADYDRITDSGIATKGEIEGAWVAMTKAQIDYRRSIGEDVSALEAELEKQENVHKKHGQAVKTVWGQIGEDISRAFDQASLRLSDAMRDLFTGEFSFSKVGDAFKELGLNIASAFLDVGAKAVTDFIKVHLAKLLEAIPGVGKALGGIFGSSSGIGGAIGGSSGGGGIPGAIGGSTGGAGGVIGSAVGGGASNLAGWISAGAGIATAVSSVIGNFQAAKQETTLNAIEESTRYSKAYNLLGVTLALEYWPKIAGIHDFLWNQGITAWTETTAEIQGAKDYLRDLIFKTADMLNISLITRDYTIATYELLRDNLTMPSVAGPSMALATVGGGSRVSAGSTIVIDLRGSTISDDAVAERLAQRITDRIRTVVR